MANKASILIKNTQGRIFELSNSRCCIMLAKEYHMNWESVFENKKIEPNDVIINYFDATFYTANGGISGNFSLVEHCSEFEIAQKIIKASRGMLKAQYERMMMIRVAKKYGLDSQTLLKLEFEYHDRKNYELSIPDLLKDIE